MWRVVFLDAGTLSLNGDVSFDEFTRRWECAFHDATAPGETAARIAGFQAAVTNKVVFDAALLARPEAADLRVIAVAATGFNNVDLDAARRRGLPVCNVSGYAAESVAAHTWALALALLGSLPECLRDARDGAWSRRAFPNAPVASFREPAGKTLGVIGYGAIGRRVAEVARAFGMTVLYCDERTPADSPDRRVELDELLRLADVVTLHCPLTPATRNLIDARRLARMKPGAVLINTARGGIVDEMALVAALKSGHLGGAGMDVLTVEPPPADHPLIAAARVLPNLLVTPHVAWSSVEARRRLLHEVGENIAAFEAGRERSRVG